MSLPAYWIYLLSKLLQGIFHKSERTYTKYNILHIIVEKNEGKGMCLFNRKSESCSLVNKVCIRTVYVSIKLQPTLSCLLSYWILHVYIHVYMCIHLAWKIPGKKEPGKLQPIVSQRIRLNWSDLKCTNIHIYAAGMFVHVVNKWIYMLLLLLFAFNLNKEGTLCPLIS